MFYETIRLSKRVSIYTLKKGFMLLTQRAILLKRLWSKFSHYFCKLDHFSNTNNIFMCYETVRLSKKCE
jgi:hypothetical protein